MIYLDLSRPYEFLVVLYIFIRVEDPVDELNIDGTDEVCSMLMEDPRRCLEKQKSRSKSIECCSFKGLMTSRVE